jgi:alkanesulfonate monooxygenase SsuD/methylene tetrahydromethanopterin reductase-like flavin-dependent oxidoreductase (luciferase family)
MLFAHVDPSRRRALAELAPRLALGYGESFTSYIDRFCAVGTVDDVAERIAEYVAAGATDLILAPQCASGAFCEQLALLAQAAGLTSHLTANQRDPVT